jgi:deoxyribodipyrimidine photo-lyase
MSIKDRYYKEHPLNIGYSGKMENRDWISDEVTGYFPSFFSYWKKIEKQLKD